MTSYLLPWVPVFEFVIEQKATPPMIVLGDDKLMESTRVWCIDSASTFHLSDYHHGWCNSKAVEWFDDNPPSWTKKWE